MKKRISLILALALTLSSFSGCGKAEEKAYVPTGDALVMEGEEAVETLPDDEDLEELTLAYSPKWSMNPLEADNLNNRVLFSLIYQGLFSVDANSNTTPILCSGYRVSPDRKIYTFLVDPAARFSDGTRVTGNDVLATYEMARVSTWYSGRFTHILDIRLSDENSVTFELDTPYENLAILLDIPIMKAAEVAAEYPVGTGPFALTFVQPEPGSEPETEPKPDPDTESDTQSDVPQTEPQPLEKVPQLSRVENWWCGDMNVFTNADVITLKPAVTQAEIRDEFQFGDLGLAAANPMSDKYADYRCDYELWESDNGLMVYIGINTLYSDFFKNDKQNILRKALSKAIDREYINNTFYNGKCLPSPLPTSPNSIYYSETLASQFQYDPLGFSDELLKYNMPRDKKGLPVKFKLLVNADDSARLRTARYLAAELTELGLETGVLEYGSTGKYTFEDVLRAGTYDIFLGETRLSPNYDLSEFFRSGGKLSWGGIVDGDILKLQREALADRGNYYNLNKMVAEDCKIIPILFGTTLIYANRGQLLNLSPSRENPFYYSIGKTMEGIKLKSEG